MKNQHLEQIDVVIPTRNRAALIGVAIASVCASSHDNFRLWIVDQSDDESTEQVVAESMATDCRICYLRSNSRGANFARNEGVASGSAMMIAFIDDDCRVARDWLSALVAELRQPDIWAVFGRVIPDEGDPLLQQRNSHDRQVSRAIPMALKDASDRGVYGRNRFNLGFGHGANMGWRRDAFLRLGGFDGLIGAGGPLGTWDERDAGYRVFSQHKGQIVYTPQAVVYHRHWRGWTEVRNAYRGYAIGTGAAAIKYIRCGDWGGFYFLLEWVLDQGVRQMVSGVLKWQSWQKVYVGWLQVIYPWVGVLLGLRHPIDRKHVLYQNK